MEVWTCYFLENMVISGHPSWFSGHFSPPVRWGLLDFMSACRSSSSSSSSSSSFSSPDLNRDRVRAVLRAGPQPRLCESSVACRTSTAIPWEQCCVPDLSRDPVRPVLRAGPQPRSCEFSVACRTSTAILWGQCSAERSVGIRDGWTLWRSTDMFDAFVYPTDMLTGGILTWFGMFGVLLPQTLLKGGLQTCFGIFDFWKCFRGSTAMFWHVYLGMFWHVCFCHGSVLFTWTRLTGAILSRRQDAPKSCKNVVKNAPMHADNSHLTTPHPTCHGGDHSK